MSRRVLISLGTAAVLGTAAYALTFFDFNFVKKEDKEFTFQKAEETLPDLEEEQEATSLNSTILPPPKESKVEQPIKKISSGSTEGKKSIRDLWSSEKNNKEAPAVQGIQFTNLIRDYSFRFVNSCTSGTIWILDYELPQDSNKYPTKFFFGTSAQVASKIKFNDSNPYKQELPKNNNCSQARIFGETDISYGGADHFRKHLWKANEHGFLDEKHSDNDVKKWLEEESHKPPYFYYEASNVNLAYVATDFIDKSKDNSGDCNKQEDKYISDFAVIEIDFEDSKISKRMTRDFYKKYNSKGKIDFFAKPLMERKSNKDLYQESIDIYIAGYSQNGLRGRSTGSFNLDQRQASKLTFIDSKKMIKDNNEEEVIGHTNACYSETFIEGYGDSKRHLKGVEIVLAHDPLDEGSSGSLVIDSEGNAIGVKSRYESDQISFVTSFRSKEIKYNEKVIIPAYDLIEGINGGSQHRSYKSSIVDNLISQNKETYLSKMKNWKAK